MDDIETNLRFIIIPETNKSCMNVIAVAILDDLMDDQMDEHYPILLWSTIWDGPWGSFQMLDRSWSFFSQTQTEPLLLSQCATVGEPGSGWAPHLLVQRLTPAAKTHCKGNGLTRWVKWLKPSTRILEHNNFTIFHMADTTVPIKNWMLSCWCVVNPSKSRLVSCWFPCWSHVQNDHIFVNPLATQIHKLSFPGCWHSRDAGGGEVHHWALGAIAYR